VWFFIATVGCWSVQETIPLSIAMLLIVYYLTLNIFSGVNWKKSFRSEMKDLLDEVNQSGVSSEKKNELIGEVTTLKEEYLGCWSTCKHNHKFLLAWLFYGISVYFFII
jgi:hypothetical protein